MGIERTILIILKGVAKGTKNCQPEWLGSLGRANCSQSCNHIIQNVTRVSGDNRLKTNVSKFVTAIQRLGTYLKCAEEDLEELVESRQA